MREREQVAAAALAVAPVTERLRSRVRRGAAHRPAGASLRGLLGGAERTNGWQLAEELGYPQPRAIQRVLDRSVWDAFGP